MERSMVEELHRRSHVQQFAPVLDVQLDPVLAK